jgi:hypothetical protein
MNYQRSKVWGHIVLLLPHTDGGFGVTFNDVTKDAAFSHERHDLWLPKSVLQDSSSWSSTPLLLLRDIHSKLLADYGCKEVCAPSQSQAHAGASGVFWWTQLPGQ